MAHLQMWFAACVLATPTWTLRTLGSYSEFCTKYGRQHVDQQDYTMRQELYRQRVAAVQEINGHQTLPWKASVNAFADFTREEFSQLLGHRRGASAEPKLLAVECELRGCLRRQAALPDRRDPEDRWASHSSWFTLKCGLAIFEH
ncbi:unnamed protein product [Durusdinium trenchii]|uniref:Cathepsin propeptide inhibitor domain-containing protein n=1 Tax=Durusdinium trenchii TaxID=1381693 RepID=A0ABP0MWU7_9DINO